jgi:hypothetical protein
LQKFILTLCHCPISRMLLISPVTILRPLSPLRFAKYKVFIFCIYLVFMFDVWSIRSTAQFCNIIIPNVHYLLSGTVIKPL